MTTIAFIFYAAWVLAKEFKSLIAGACLVAAIVFGVYSTIDGLHTQAATLHSVTALVR